jgi:Kef-type K+ transport system membrane component KefB
MDGISVEIVLILLCSLVIVSYLFSILSHYIKVPSVLLLLFAGMAIRAITDAYQMQISIPEKIIELLGIVGLIMIVLEAGLDLRMGKDKLKLIRASFLSALVIFIISSVLITLILYLWLHEPVKKCLVYAIPLSIMSSSIVIPSIHQLAKAKKEFLVYEASFSDILGILVFNYFIAGNPVSWKNAAGFGLTLTVSIALSVLLSFLLFLILAKTRMQIKFFLIFSLLILIYAGGKMLHLPSLLIILVFGLLINNWDKIQFRKLQRFFPQNQVTELRYLLHSITAESSFLIRTFFFVLFGFSISLSFLKENEVILVGSMIVIALLIVRLLYLRFFLHTNVIPEVFFIPRGLITIVLFYKIPPALRLDNFNDGILFFIILVTGIIMAAGMIFYKKKPEQIIEEGQFSDQGDNSP